MNKVFIKLLGLAVIMTVLMSSCTTHYYVTIKDDPKTVPPSVVRAKFKAEKKGPLRRILFFLPPVPADNLEPRNFARSENGEYIDVEAQLNIKPNLQAFQINTVLLLDNSLSIQDENLPDVKNAAKKLIQKKMSYQKYAIAAFSGEEKLALLSDFTGDIPTLEKAIDKIELGVNSTNLYGATSDGLDFLSVQEGKMKEGMMSTYQIILFTDGADTQGMVSLKEVLDKRNSKNYEIIPVGVSSKELDKKALRQLSTLKKLWNRKFYRAKNFAKLEKTFDKMREYLEKDAKSHYYLEYMSPKRGDKQNSFMIRVEPKAKIWKFFNRIGTYFVDYNKIKGSFNSKEFYSVKKGICVTANNDFKESKDIWDNKTIIFSKNQQKELQFFSVGGKTSYPKYTISLDNSNFTTDKIEKNIDDWLIFKAVGRSGSETKLTITDAENGFTQVITLKIK